MIRGIQNVSGVGCHLSCALLILCHTLVPLREAMLCLVDSQDEYSRQTNNHLVLELGRLLKDMAKTEEAAVEPSKFFTAIQSQCNAYDLGDATRALTVLLKLIRSIFQEEGKVQDDFQALYNKLLTGTQERVICGRKTVEGKTLVRTKRKQNPLGTPFPLDGRQLSIGIALQTAMDPVTVKGYNWEMSEGYQEDVLAVYQENSSADWQTTKQLAITSLPASFLFHLQRFEYQNGQMEAHEQPMDVPKSLDVLSHSYELVGGILHHDEAERDEDYEGGHYTTVLRDNDQWCKVDGEEVTSISETKALDLLSGRTDDSLTRGTLVVYSQTNAEADRQTLLDTFCQSLAQSTLEGQSLFPATATTTNDSDDKNPRALVGKRVRIRWSGGKLYEGTVTHYDEASGKHRVQYDDGDVKNYRLHKKVVEWID